MRLRHLAAALLGLGLIALGVSTLGRPPARAPAIDLNDGTIQVSATAAGLGSWVPYTITVRNLGEQRFEGDLLLVNHPSAGPPPAAAGKGWGGLPAVFFGSSADATGAVAAPDSAYQFRLFLDARHKRVLTVTAPGQFSQAEVRDAGGVLVAEVPIGDRSALAVGVLSDSPAVVDSLARVRFGEVAVRPVAYGSGRPLPASPLGYAGLVALVLDRTDTRALAATQVAALREFVGFGGTLVLAGAGGLEASVRSLPAELLPLAPSGGALATLQPLADLGAGPGAPTVPIATGILGGGARLVLGGPGGPPLGVEREYGSGRVEELLFDPADPAVIRSGLDALAWSLAVGRGLDRLPGSLPTGATVLEPDTIPSQLLPSPLDAPLPSLPLVLGLASAYILAVGPGVFLLLRRARRPTLVWVAAPALAVVFSLAAYLAGAVLQGGVRDQQVNLVKIGPDGSAATLTYHGIAFPLRGAHSVSLAPGSLGVPLTLAYPGLIPRCPGCYLRVAGLRSGVEEHLRPGPPPTVVETGVVYGSVRVVGEASTARLPVAVEAHLAAVDDRLRGTVSNRGRVTLRDVRVYAYYIDSVRSVPIGGDLAPGATVSVDLALGRINDFLPPSRGRAVLAPGVGRRLVADEAATRVLDRAGQVVVAGIAEVPTRAVRVDGGAAPGSAVTAVAQAFELEAASARVGNWTRARLNSSLPLAGSGPALVNTYDLEVPAISADPVFRFDNRVYTEVEVYSWTAGTWRASGFEDDIQSPLVRLTQLRPGELDQGRVRVRVHETALTWGRELILRYPGETP